MPSCTADPTTRTTWVVTLLTDDTGLARIVADPTGLTSVNAAPPTAIHAATRQRGGVALTWAWGRLPAHAPTPDVWFHGRWRRRGRRADVRRLSATVWAAQASGRWRRVWLA